GSWDVVPADWALNSVGQITEIAALNGDTVFVKSPFRINFDTALHVEVRKIVPRVNAGVECLSVKRLNTIETDPGSNFYLAYAAHCRIAGIKSDSSSGSHISVNASANILISGCYLHHAFLYDGSGTRGYGVTLSMHSSECLILNSVFKHLRHAMMVKTGSNGNIFAYNFSVDPYRSELIHDLSGDISLHGHYAFSNLFEGNIVQNIITDHFWGPTGPWNTFFRNRSELYGIIMTSSSLLETSSQNYIGNEVTASNYPYGQYILSGEDQFQYSNNINGAIIPPGTEVLNDESYFLTSSPDFWTENLVWPSIGYPNELGEGLVPAKDRYLSDIVPVLCPGDTNLTYQIEYLEDASRLKLFPNPANGRFTVYIQSEDERIEFRLISLTGQCVDMFSTVSGNSGAGISIELKNHPQPGMYFLEAKSESGRKSVQRIVLY
ncbi:MAG: T9SS type A sorting domain-containing protein, partial [Bacteroidales bacterium]